MGVFEFVIALVIITTIGKAVSGRHSRRESHGALPPSGNAELERMRDTMHDLSGRLGRLEEERDFYKNLLDAPARRREISPPDGEEDASSR